MMICSKLACLGSHRTDHRTFLATTCNRVRDRYEEKVAHTLAHAKRSSRCGRQLCKQHERSNMWYQRKLIKNTYSTTAFAGLTSRRNLPRFIVYHSDVMWPYYIWRQRSVSRPRRKPNMPRKPLAATTTIKLPWCNESTTLWSTPPGCTTQVAWSVNVPFPFVLHSLEYHCPGKN
jgi:hypothetical protein